MLDIWRFLYSAARPAAAAALEQFVRWAALSKRTTALADDLSDLATATAEFAALRFWEGVVALPLAYAAAADPLNHGDPAVAAAAGALSAQPTLCELRSSCYAAVSDSLRRLAVRGGGGVGVTPADQVGGPHTYFSTASSLIEPKASVWGLG